MALAAAYGIFGRRLSRRERGRVVERPGRFYVPYVAAAVTATVRMWLAVIEHLLAEAEITVMAREYRRPAPFLRTKAVAGARWGPRASKRSIPTRRACRSGRSFANTTSGRFAALSSP